MSDTEISDQLVVRAVAAYEEVPTYGTANGRRDAMRHVLTTVLTEQREAAPAANRERVAKMLTYTLDSLGFTHHHDRDRTLPGALTNTLFSSGVLRDEAEVKAEVAEEIATALEAVPGEVYSEDFFPPDGTGIDCQSARVMRVAYPAAAHIAREIGGT